MERLYKKIYWTLFIQSYLKLMWLSWNIFLVISSFEYFDLSASSKLAENDSWHKRTSQYQAIPFHILVIICIWWCVTSQWCYIYTVLHWAIKIEFAQKQKSRFPFDISWLNICWIKKQIGNICIHYIMVSWMYSAMAIGYVFGNIVTGYIADHIKEPHRSQAIIILITSICAILLPFIDNLIIMFSLFIVIGIGWAGNETNDSLLIFRLYPINTTKMFFWCSMIVMLFGVISTLSIELSIHYTNVFSYPFIAFPSYYWVHRNMIHIDPLKDLFLRISIL